VVGDIIDLARSIHRQVQNRAAFDFDPAVGVVPMDEVRTRAYFRCRLADRPGVLGAMFRIFGDEGVSVSGAIQKESDGTAAEFVVTTHPAPDAALQRTRSRVIELDVVQAVESFLRVL
jgi:homoserine dehydrogenase